VTNATGTPLSGIVIGLDPGHQAHSNSDHEPIAPGSGETKKKVSSGTQGRFTGVAEYEVNLQVGLKLKQILTDLGATVVMTRESHDVDISNSERATMMNDAGAALVVRLHCNGSDNSDKHGAVVLIPSNDCTAAINDASKEAGRCIIKAFVEATGAKDLGLQPRSDQTGFNWSTVPVCNVEMGYMTNEQEDKLLVKDDYQDLCAHGIANGIVDYFS
jgi:N-acetylmuramoyl-L-alanine amidase